MISIKKTDIPSIVKGNLSIMCKFLFSFIITLLTVVATDSWWFVCIGTLELVIITLATLIIAEKNHKIASVFNSLFIFIYNIETLVLCFSGMHVKRIMLENIASLESLSGNFAIYFVALIFLLLFSFLPIKKLVFPQKPLKDQVF